MTAQIIPVDPDNARTLARHATEIRRLGKQVVSDVIEIGRLLVESKKLAGHGNWLSWLEREFQWTDDTALNYMRVHELGEKFRTVRDLDIPMRGLYLLAKPSTPETAKQEAISRAEAGEPMTLNTVKEIVERVKAPLRLPVRFMTGKQVAKMVSGECRFRDGPPPTGDGEEQRGQHRSPKLLKVGTIVDADVEHVSCIHNNRSGFMRGTIAEVVQDLGEDCGGDRRYVIRVEAVISGAHLKRVRSAKIPVAADYVDAVIRLDPEQAAAVDEWRRHYVEDLPPLAEAIIRLMEIGLKEQTGRSAEDKPIRRAKK
jgi:hypothetical protein